MIKIMVEINKIETKKYKESMRQIALEKINKINKHLANLTEMRRENTQINKIRNEKDR
jgi:hypothetical protein